jgi:PPOX class probable F420-dependent enzyme
MSAQEVDDFLGAERTCRVATVGGNGGPHVAPLWFVWDGAALWLNSLTRSQRWTDLARDPRIAVVVDAGVEYTELRGVEVSGRAEVVGEVPRGEAENPELAPVERAFARKYGGTDTYVPDGRHAWMRITPDKLVSWDFRKLGAPRG